MLRGILVLVCCCLSPVPCHLFAQASVSVHLTLGNPTHAATGENNYLVVRKQYCLSYNRAAGEANWVSWHLCKGDLGRCDRQNDFRGDDSLPAAWFHPTKALYDNSGFDCGHLCPSSDRTRTMADNQATFLLSNMIPQAPKNNRVAWKMLESYERDLLASGNEEYLIAGPLGRGGCGAHGYKLRLSAGDGKAAVIVPNSCWKVLVSLPEADGDDVARITASTRVICALVPNNERIDADWRPYRLSIDDLEELLSDKGFSFLPEVPARVRHALKAKVDSQ